MPSRISRESLDPIVRRINLIAGMPERPYLSDDAGRLQSQPGNFHLSMAYGGVALHRMSMSGAGTHDITGYLTSREQYHALHALREGLSLGREIEAESIYHALKAAGHDPVALLPLTMGDMEITLARRAADREHGLRVQS